MRRRQHIRDARREERDDRPRRFDPDQRGRDFPNKRKRRGRPGETKTTERRITDLETWSYQSTRVAIQTPSASRIEVVAALPEPSPLDIGRQLIVRSPAAVRDVLYIGMQQSDGAVVWVQWTSSYEGGGGVPVDNNSVSVTFMKNIPLGVNLLRCAATTDYVYYTYDSGVVRRYSRSTGAITDPAPGFFSSTTPGYGIHAEDDGKIWVATSNAAFTVGQVKYWNGSSVGATSATLGANGLAGLDRSPTTGKIHVGGGDVGFGTAFGRWRLNPTTLATEDSSTGSDWGVTGVAVDNDGLIYWIHVYRVVVTDENLDIVRTFDPSGSIYGTLFGRNADFDANNRLYIADDGSHSIKVFSDIGTPLGTFGVGGTGPGEFNNPRDVTIHGNYLWVADRGNGRLSQWMINN